MVYVELEDILEQTVADINSYSVSFIHGSIFDGNIDADETPYPLIIAEEIRANGTTNITGGTIFTHTIRAYVLFKSELDDEPKSQRNAHKQMCRKIIREWLSILSSADNIREINSTATNYVKNQLDSNGDGYAVDITLRTRGELICYKRSTN